MFHHHVAELLYLSKQEIPDIQTAVYYICTRVQNPNILYEETNMENEISAAFTMATPHIGIRLRINIEMVG